MIDVEEYQQNTGWRGVFHAIPSTRSTAQKLIMPLGYFYSPFLAEVNPYKATPLLCTRCRASICPTSSKNKGTKTWVCGFCQTSNSLNYEIGNETVQQYVQGKNGENGIFFLVDLCLSEQQLNAIKQSLKNTIQQLPSNIYVGLLAFNRNIFVLNLEDLDVKFQCVSGLQDYGTAPFVKVRENLGFGGNIEQKIKQKLITTRHYSILNSNNRSILMNAVSSLRKDSYFVPRDQRQKRATGSAFQVALGLIGDIPINTRFVSLIGGPCTHGNGKVVGLYLKNTIRSYVDILQGNQNTEHMKSATTFYDGLADFAMKGRHTFDIWSYGLDQFGLLQMKGLVNSTGGILAMHQQFNHFIFKSSFSKFYQTDQQGALSYPIATTISIRVSNGLKINGILGPCKSLKENSQKLAAQMQIGQGGTSSWYLGGICTNASLCIILSLGQLLSNEPKQRIFQIQAVTNYKWSDNVLRTRVSTFKLQIIRENQIMQFGKRFDQEAATVMLARMAAKKAQIQDSLEVKKWVDRILLKFCVRFANFNRNDKSSFRLPQRLKHFPQFIYHLRRSNFINPFGAPPDQSNYTRTCLLRQSVANCMTMIQPSLLSYTTDQPIPHPVQLDFGQLKQDVILLLDSYFNVLVWYGESAYNWKQDGLQQQQEYQYLRQFFAAPMQDASDLMYDRIPVSNFYQTFKNDGKQRYLKSRVNPSKRKTQQDDGHFVSDDAPINVFMDYLVKSVINYNE